MIQIKYRLKELRIEAKKKKKEIADLLNITSSTYGRYENGKRTVPVEILWALADYYKESIDYLVGRID